MVKPGRSFALDVVVKMLVEVEVEVVLKNEAVVPLVAKVVVELLTSVVRVDLLVEWNEVVTGLRLMQFGAFPVKPGLQKQAGLIGKFKQ